MNLASLYILLPLILWPLTTVLFAKFSRSEGSLNISFYRQLGIALVGAPLLFFLSLPSSILLEHFWNVFLASFFGSTYVFITFFGFAYLPVPISRIYHNISRVAISIGMGFFFLGEVLSIMQILGTLLLLSGIFFLRPSSIDVSHLEHRNRLLGIAIALFSGVLFTLSLYYFKLYTEAIDPLLGAYILEVVNGLFLFVGVIIVSTFKKKLPLIPTKDFGIILLLSPLVLVATYGAAKAYEIMEFSIVNIILVFLLVFSLIFSWIFLGEKLTKKQLGVFALMIIGLILLRV